jgi:hypothetical protein
MKEQVKTKKRVEDHGEVFTSHREVNAMLDLVKQETERIDSRFLEPACGDGNFLVEVLRRKLAVVDRKYSKSQIEWERNMFVAVTSIYGVDILEDNAVECQNRLFDLFSKAYVKNFGINCKNPFINSIRFLLIKNILWGDALDFTNPLTKKPIVFSEWSLIKSTMVKRRDFRFKFLVERTHQFTLNFNDEGQPAAIDEPVKDFPLVHFLKIADANEYKL